MRKAFVSALTDLARKNKNIFVLTGDLGFSVFEDFKNKFPGRFFDVGVAEQDMVGIAAGLALSGKTVFVYSIVPFVVMRAFEQIRNDLCMQNLNVKIVGMGAGLHYGSAGPTHHAIEDISLMRSLPKMTVVCPSSPCETAQAIQTAARQRGPVYLRLSQSYGPIEYCKKQKFRLGKGILIRQGKDITLISCGSILYKAKEAAEYLKEKGISVRLINMHTIKPIDRAIILKAIRETRAIFTIEEHLSVGGLGSAVGEVVVEASPRVIFKRISLKDSFVTGVGSREYLLKKSNLSVSNIAVYIMQNIKGKI